MKKYRVFLFCVVYLLVVSLCIIVVGTGVSDKTALDSNLVVPETEAIGGLEIDLNHGPDPYTVNYTLSSGDTLFSLLLDHGLSRDDANRAVNAFSLKYNPRRLRVGQQFSALFEGEEALLTSFTMQVDPAKEIIVSRGADNSFKAEERFRELVGRSNRVDGIIGSTLYGAAVDAGLPVGILTDLIYLYSFDIDFQREIQRGDTFSVLFEQYHDTAGNFVRYGDILYAELSVNGISREIYLFTLPDGEKDFFDNQGKSARKTLLKTPINGAHLTSGYGMRVSPILGYSRFHPGVDFAAREGTPIYTAGDGTIKEMGYNEVYGRYIKITHANGYATLYAHMSAYSAGMRRGEKVRQGSVIGFVGSTGMSTGPHLHYEVHYQGKHINPAILNFPPGKTLKGEDLVLFEKQRNYLKSEHSRFYNQIRMGKRNILQ